MAKGSKVGAGTRQMTKSGVDRALANTGKGKAMANTRGSDSGPGPKNQGGGGKAKGCGMAGANDYNTMPSGFKGNK